MMGQPTRWPVPVPEGVFQIKFENSTRMKPLVGVFAPEGLESQSSLR